MDLRLDHRLGPVYSTIESYYDAKVSKHGPTPLGVDWSCVATQQLRFVQLLKICDFGAPFLLNDVGCGYGAVLAYMAERHPQAKVDYLGLDVSAAMIAHAIGLYGHRPDRRFMVARDIPRVVDYSIASGIFNVKLDQPVDVWEYFIGATIRQMHATSRRSFSVNFLAPAAAGQSSTASLYRTPAEPWVRFCENKLGCSADIVAGYGLREFTLLVRR
jgi:hypothetical protein